MKIKGEGTKQQILGTALNLFSKRGYSAVSIRDICGEVGIKESTIYYHFKNKQDIYDVLCDSFMQTTYSIPMEFESEKAKAFSVSEKDFTLVCMYFVNDYLMDEQINKFIRMLILEQNINPQAATLYRKVLFDDAYTEQLKIFSWLVEINFLQNVNVEYMVMDYYAPIIYMFHKYLVGNEITDSVKKDVNGLMDTHVKHFLKKYRAAKED